MHLVSKCSVKGSLASGRVGWVFWVPLISSKVCDFI